jgi:hypothetical protein
MLESTKQKNQGRKHLRKNDPQFKEELFKKVYARSARPFAPGTRVRQVNSSNKGEVIAVYENFADVLWDGTTPEFIEVVMDSGQVVVCSPYKLTRKNTE